MQILPSVKEQNLGHNEALVIHWLNATCPRVNFLYILKPPSLKLFSQCGFDCVVWIQWLQELTKSKLLSSFQAPAGSHHYRGRSSEAGEPQSSRVSHGAEGEEIPHSGSQGHPESPEGGGWVPGPQHFLHSCEVQQPLPPARHCPGERRGHRLLLPELIRPHASDQPLSVPVPGLLCSRHSCLALGHSQPALGSRSYPRCDATTGTIPR